MKCDCQQSDLVVWQGANEIGYGCNRCKNNWLPKKYIDALQYHAHFCQRDLEKNLTQAERVVSQTRCPQGCGALTVKTSPYFSVHHCEQCEGILLTKQQARAFYKHYKIKNNAKKWYYAFDISAILALFTL